MLLLTEETPGCVKGCEALVPLASFFSLSWPCDEGIFLSIKCGWLFSELVLHLEGQSSLVEWG